jgi:hypothetical protein
LLWPPREGRPKAFAELKLLHLESSVLADKFEFGFMKGVETQFVCERGLEALCNYRTMRETSTGLARDEPVHDFSSHASDALRVVAEAEMAHMLSGAGSTGTSVRRQPVKVIFGLRGNAPDPEPDVLDRFFGGPQRARVIR